MKFGDNAGMSLNESDTIAAIATPPGSGGIGVVRVSGLGAAAVAHAMLGSSSAYANYSAIAFI